MRFQRKHQKAQIPGGRRKTEMKMKGGAMEHLEN